MSNTSLLGSFGGQGDSSLMFRNRIVNGCMRIDQRNAGAAVTLTTATTIYTLDRWACNKDTAGATVTAQQSLVAPTGLTRSILLTVSTGASAGASDQNVVQQIIEGFNVGDLNWGTVSAQSVAVSFWVRSSVTGTYGLSVSNSAANRAYLATYSIDSVNTWEYKTVVIPGDTTGTWLVDNSAGIRVRWDFGSGSSKQGTAGSWGTTLFNTVSTRANLIGTSGATFYITGVQLEAGPTATPFERRPYSVELGMCQRYYWKLTGNPYTWFGTAHVRASDLSRAYVAWQLPVTMRIKPALGYSGVSTINASRGFTSMALDPNISTDRVPVAEVVISSGWAEGVAFTLGAANNSASYVDFSAEL